MCSLSTLIVNNNVQYHEPCCWSEATLLSTQSLLRLNCFMSPGLVMMVINSSCVRPPDCCLFCLLPQRYFSNTHTELSWGVPQRHNPSVCSCSFLGLQNQCEGNKCDWFYCHTTHTASRKSREYKCKCLPGPVKCCGSVLWLKKLLMEHTWVNCSQSQRRQTNAEQRFEYGECSLARCPLSVSAARKASPRLCSCRCRRRKSLSARGSPPLHLCPAAFTGTTAAGIIIPLLKTTEPHLFFQKFPISTVTLFLLERGEISSMIDPATRLFRFAPPTFVV